MGVESVDLIYSYHLAYRSKCRSSNLIPSFHRKIGLNLIDQVHFLRFRFLYKLHSSFHCPVLLNSRLKFKFFKNILLSSALTP